MDAFIEEALRWLPDENPALLAPYPAGMDSVHSSLAIDEAELFTSGPERPRILLADDNAVRCFCQHTRMPHLCDLASTHK